MLVEPRVLNVRDLPDGLPDDAVYVGRGGWGTGRRWYPRSRWGNKNSVEIYGREVAIARFVIDARKRLQREPEWLTPLRGKSLACHCAPEACHATVLLQLVNEASGAGV